MIDDEDDLILMAMVEGGVLNCSCLYFITYENYFEIDVYKEELTRFDEGIYDIDIMVVDNSGSGR